MKAIIFLAAISTSAMADTTFFSDASGSFFGTGQTIGSATFYSGQNSQPVGQALNLGNATFYTDSWGRPVAQSYNATPSTPQQQIAIQPIIPMNSPQQGSK
jgi:hypothetical protein